jgi:hypothetical protein
LIIAKIKKINKIGIDLDNTIISYDSAFKVAAIRGKLIKNDEIENVDLSKRDIKNIIQSTDDGEIKWQKLQGFVYGKGINKAKLFPGVYRFLWRCSINDVIVEVVSHKTIYGHFDKDKINLREAANQFLKVKGVFGEGNSFIRKITYKSKKSEKIDYIKNSNFCYFIDDLDDIVFSNKLKDQSVLLFSPNTGEYPKNKHNYIGLWPEISKIIFGRWDANEVASLVKSIDEKIKIKTIKKIVGRGNSEIYKIKSDNSKDVVLKIYPQNKGHNRLMSEYFGLKNLREVGVDNIQQSVNLNKKLGVATYKYIDGQSVEKYSLDDIQQVLDLISKVHSKRNEKIFSNFQFASDACLSGKDIENQIYYRLNELSLISSKYAGLNDFLKNIFIPRAKEIIDWSKSSQHGILWHSVKITRKGQTLSPSDLGLHNAIRLENGKLIFHDFEYFGWDDPVKLIADFSHHAAMHLTEDMEYFWFNGVSKIYGKHVLEKLKFAWPLYGLNWCLIILNEFKSSSWQRRCAADEGKVNQRTQQLAIQLAKAEQKIYYISKVYKDKKYW